MKILSVKTSPAFGKTAVLECKVKDVKTNTANDATLFKLDFLNPLDVADVNYSKNTTCIREDFLKANLYRESSKDFFVLKDDKSGEVISCASACRRYGNYDKPKITGKYTLIDEMSENPKYINGGEPLLAYIVKDSGERYSKAVYTAYNLVNSDEWSDYTENQNPSLKLARFTDDKTKGSYLPENRYMSFLDIAEKRNQINWEV